MPQLDRAELPKPLSGTIDTSLTSKAVELGGRLEQHDPLGRMVSWRMRIVGGAEEFITLHWKHEPHELLTVIGQGRPTREIEIRFNKRPDVALWRLKQELEAEKASSTPR